VTYRVGTDVGGTFTDVWVGSDDGRSASFKAATTADVISGVLAAMRLAAAHFEVDLRAFCAGIERFGHGTTVGLNALLTGATARTTVVTTAGFGDTLELGRMRRQTSTSSDHELGDFLLRGRRAPIVPRSRVVEIDERVDATGRVVKPLDESTARAALAELAARGAVEAIAICMLWSTELPDHERRLGELARELFPDAFVALSTDIAPFVGEYARMSTTAANAAIGPVAGRYAHQLSAELSELGLRVPVMMTTSAGAVLPAETIAARPIAALFSGPAAGVIGAAKLGADLGLENLLTIDIGGTSFDVGLVVAGAPTMRSEITVAGADVRVLSVDVESIGAGGGSIASVAFGDLTVGPRSAGARPGPACYGRGGTEPTTTDADLVLGVLDPAAFLGGRMPLDVERARAAIEEHIARPLGLSLLEAAWGIREVIDSRMADLLRRVTIERGHDPRDFTLVVLGGAGPSHAWMLARELGLRGFIVPAAATAACAYGAACSDAATSAERTAYVRLRPGEAASVSAAENLAVALRAAESDVVRLLAGHGADGIAVERSAAVRFRGQAHHLDIPVPVGNFDIAALEGVLTAFERRYESLFGSGSSFAGAGYELLGVRAVGRAVLAAPAPPRPGTVPERCGERDVVFADPAHPEPTAIYKTDFPAPQTDLRGPCIVEYPGQSVVVPPGWHAHGDDSGTLHVLLEAS